MRTIAKLLAVVSVSALAAATSVVGVGLPTTAFAVGPTPIPMVPLGSAASFAVLTLATVGNTASGPVTTLRGDLGAGAGTTGFLPVSLLAPSTRARPPTRPSPTSPSPTTTPRTGQRVSISQAICSANPPARGFTPTVVQWPTPERSPSTQTAIRTPCSSSRSVAHCRWRPAATSSSSGKQRPRTCSGSSPAPERSARTPHSLGR